MAEVGGTAEEEEEEEEVAGEDSVEWLLQVSQTTRAFCSQVASLGVAEMRLNQADRAGLSFNLNVSRSRIRATV
ncbi:hypothetical protein SAMN05428953_101338 [Mesorhizobium muleiense]|uniref:Uncharacterized protein n=1 Tax=Mesorhizobium muleiense TaxID=1004279 RepID=A0A1G8ID91_9HYPH|nr:hypothetical protein SAMN05428953_101338 [Mesorhizobium muleiense]